MAAKRNLSSVREAVGVFDEAAKLEAALDALMESGFNRADISLLAAQDEIEKKLGHLYAKVSELEDDPAVPRSAYISRETLGNAEGILVGLPLYIAAATAAGIVTAAGGPVAAVLAAAAIAGSGGGMLGFLLAGAVGDRYASEMEKQIERGGILLWVRTWDKTQEKRAQEILAAHGASDIHIHQLYKKTSRHKTVADFQSPETVATAPDLTKAEKIAILRNWEYDARELSVATEEGMGGNDSGLLHRILVCLHSLQKEPAVSHPSPNKQGGA